MGFNSFGPWVPHNIDGDGHNAGFTANIDISLRQWERGSGKGAFLSTQLATGNCPSGCIFAKVEREVLS